MPYRFHIVDLCLDSGGGDGLIDSGSTGVIVRCTLVCVVRVYGDS
ncbi:hypothetical protein XF_2254 [Xylella fastidiosa 9a5c]|uniref:Uncharacterized protein n=1 Tax=Xylella fastidiosa (strain 9a5c) TaxID=160492 RepID=Q9PB90_XYLFA|nr:hypothetical protein XF_2254 [Xylella fastidiosa 9a5c]